MARTPVSASSPLAAERTMLTALLLSSPGPLATGIAAITCPSAIQISDFSRRTAELVVLFLSWYVYRKLRRGNFENEAQRLKWERSVGLSAGGVMACSGTAMLVMAVFRLAPRNPGGNAALGLGIAILGLVTNAFFLVRYRRITREVPGSVIGVQVTLYSAKTSVDVFVVAGLLAVTKAPGHPVTRSLDLLGSLVVACYLVWNGLRTIWQNKSGW